MPRTRAEERFLAVAKEKAQLAHQFSSSNFQILRSALKHEHEHIERRVRMKVEIEICC